MKGQLEMLPELLANLIHEPISVPVKRKDVSRHGVFEETFARILRDIVTSRLSVDRRRRGRLRGSIDGGRSAWKTDSPCASAAVLGRPV